MGQKYEVPAIRRAHEILNLIANNPKQLKLIDLANRLAIHKSSMFSLLKTLEDVNWVTREVGDTYALGSACGYFGGSFFRQYDLISRFHQEASLVSRSLKETIQLAKLDAHEVFYLAKVDADSPVKIVSEPGMKFSTHCTALGKALIAEHSVAELRGFFSSTSLPTYTPNTISDFDHLVDQLAIVRAQGYAEDLQESVMGFQCVAVAIRDQGNRIFAAVSCSMPIYHWQEKKTLAIHEITQLASKLSFVGKA